MDEFQDESALSGTPNDLDSFWVPFTPNRQFKKNPRIVVSAKGIVDQGPGMLNVSSALEVYRALAERPAPEPRTWMVMTESPDAPGHVGPSAHWRGITPPRAPERQQVSVRPDFSPAVTDEQRQNFYRGFDLVSDSKWVRPAERAVYSRASSEFDFGLTYTTQALGHPGLYTARIKAYDKNLSRKQREALGPDWEVPVSVVVPHEPQPGEILILESKKLSPAAIQRFYVRVPVGASGWQISARSLDTSQSHRLFLHDPEGRGDRFGRVGRDHGPNVDHRVAGEALEPGVWELVVYADYENAAPAAAELVLRFDALALADGELELSASEGGTPEGTLALVSRAPAPLRAEISAEVIGFRVESCEKKKGDLRMPIELGPQVARVELNLEIDAKTFGRATDIAVRILDGEGLALLSDGFGQRKLHTHFDRPGAEAFSGKLEILPGLADPDDKRAFPVHIARDYHYAAPVALEIESGSEQVLYPDRRLALDLKAASTPPALPAGAKWLVKVTATDVRDGKKAAELLLEANAN